MIYNQQQKDSIIYQSQVWLSDLGVKLEALERSMQPCDELYCNGHRVRVFMSALQRVPFLEEEKKEYIYTCLVKLTGIKDYPVAIPLTEVKPPDIIIGSPGPAGPPGSDGVDGTNANIEVVSTIDSIKIIESVDPVDPNKKIYTLEDNTYIEPTVTLVLNPSTPVVEIGNLQNIDVEVTLVKGRDDVLTSVLTPAALDPTYQAGLDLPALNAGGPGLRTVLAANVGITTTYTVNISDGQNTNQASKTVTYVYPFFSGNTPTEPINPYLELANGKLLQTKGTKKINFNGVSQYFWFCYPASYGDLASIKDQNGFEVLGSFTKIVQDVTSTGLTNNWTESYFLYRTTVLTDINGEFTFSF